MKLLRNQRGTTILEVIVTVLILTIALSILGTGFLTAAKLVGEANRCQTSIDKQISAINGEEIDGVKIVEKEKQAATFIANEKVYTFNFKTKETLDLTNDAFILKDMLVNERDQSNVEWTMYQNYKKMFAIYNNFSELDKQNIIKELALTSTRFDPTNDNFLRYMHHYIYKDTWPQLPEHLTPPGQKVLFYIRICAQSGVLNEDTELIIYAKPGATHEVGLWYNNPFVIYDYGDGIDPETASGWYYRKAGSSANSILTGTTWKAFRETKLLLQQDGWIKLGK